MSTGVLSGITVLDLTRVMSGPYCTGPSQHLAGYDGVTQAEGGLMSITGDPGGPPLRLGVPIADLVSGLFAAQGILAH